MSKILFENVKNIKKALKASTAVLMGTLMVSTRGYLHAMKPAGVPDSEPASEQQLDGSNAPSMVKALCPYVGEVEARYLVNDMLPYLNKCC